MQEQTDAGVIRFKATLIRQPDSSATFIMIPFDVQKEWGMRSRVPVKGTINGHSFRSSIAPYGGVHYLGINRDLREAAGVKAGEVVQIELEIDQEPRAVVLPSDLQSAMDTTPAAKIRWQKISFTQQREYVEMLEDAKKPDTRAKRVANIIDKLQGKIK